MNSNLYLNKIRNMFILRWAVISCKELNWGMSESYEFSSEGLFPRYATF